MTVQTESEKEIVLAPMSPAKRAIMVGLGCFFVGLGAVGVILPVLPTTPFLLLASAFFVRSSPTLHRWLLRSRVFGPFLRDWHQHRGVRLSVKIVAVAMIALVVSLSLILGKLSTPLMIMLLSLAAIGIYVVIRLPLIRSRESTPPPS